MSFDAAVAIISLALSLLRDQSAGKVSSDAALAQTLIEIVRIAKREYEDRVGQPLDPTLIKAESTV